MASTRTNKGTKNVSARYAENEMAKEIADKINSQDFLREWKKNRAPRRRKKRATFVSYAVRL